MSDEKKSPPEADPDWEPDPEKPGHWRLRPEVSKRRLAEAMERVEKNPDQIIARKATELAEAAVEHRSKKLDNAWRRLLGGPGTSREQQARELIGPGTKDWPHGIESWTFDGVGIDGWYSEEHARRLAERVIDGIQKKPLLHALVELTDHSEDDVAAEFLKRLDTKDECRGYMFLRDALIALDCDPDVAKNTTKKQRV